ncbi:MAG: PP2C family protein-serine/threonine phosphatase [Terracidiphilus sp.]
MAPVWIAVCGAVFLAAQATPPSPNPAPAASPKPHIHAKPAKLSAPFVVPAIIDATNLGSPVPVDKNWRVGITSDLTASSPTFDDSKWAVRDAQPSIGEVPDEDANAPASTAKPPAGAPTAPTPATPARRYAWFRLHVQLAPHHGPLALLIELPVTHGTTLEVGSPGLSPEVFANGKQVQPEGPHGDTPEEFQPISRVYNLNLDPSQSSLTLVVRVIYAAFGNDAYTGFFATRTLYLGNPVDIQREFNLWSDRMLFERLPELIYSILLVVLAVFLLALYFSEKGHPEYLWLALHELTAAPIGFIELAGSSARINALWCATLVLQLLLISAYLFFEFLVAFLSLKQRWYIRGLRYTAPVLAGVGPALLFLFHRGVIFFLVAIFVSSVLWIIGWSIFIFGTLISAAARRNFEAGLFLVPLGFSLVAIVDSIVGSALSGEAGSSYTSPLTIQAGPIPIHISTIGGYAGILVIVLIVFFRYLRVQRDREHATNELAAARSVQELLIPQEKLATPGFEVDSVYSPASEVGGDFFHVQTVGREGILVVIGDVAGHGLKAAMNVSLLMGALRRTSERNPARILEALNRVLSGTGSFTTCQALWFGVNGEMVLANAGHLPPYLNSQEITLPGSLPLGVLVEIIYEEARFFLHPGDRILLLSDGVVEARHPNGELFGFDRVRQFSQEPAAYLAEAAKSFGQQDDITVLTVRREVDAATPNAPAAVLSSALS